MFQSTEKEWLPVVGEGDIERVIDSWERVSKMPKELMLTVVYLAGVTGADNWRYAPLEAGLSLRAADDVLAPTRQLREAWRARVDEVMLVDAHTALTAGVRRWLTTGCDLSTATLRGLGVPSSELLAKRLPQIWPKLDDLPAVIAFHYACALSRWTDRQVVRETATRLVAERPLPNEGIEGLWGCHLYLRWVRDVAADRPVLALKVGAEAALRWRARHVAGR